jgi:hypothetical protein
MWQKNIMIKTQISVPDELYEKAKEIAKAKEWSLAEVFRRGLEYMATAHKAEGSNTKWELPTVRCGETAPRTIKELEAIIQEEREAYLYAKAGV